MLKKDSLSLLPHFKSSSGQSGSPQWIREAVVIVKLASINKKVAAAKKNRFDNFSVMTIPPLVSVVHPK
jgi:hypothetical protein